MLVPYEEIVRECADILECEPSALVAEVSSVARVVKMLPEMWTAAQRWWASQGAVRAKEDLRFIEYLEQTRKELGGV